MRIGKTRFFRTLLPADLQEYFAELNFDNPNAKDDLIPLTKNILVLADEWQDVNKRNPKRLRWIITAQDFDIRKAYRQDEDKYTRIATIAGTSNTSDIIVEGEFNRRIIPLGIKNMNLQKWLEIDKDELFAELHRLFIAGFRYEIENDEFEKLQEIQTEYQEVQKEEELVLKHIEQSEDKEDFVTTTEVTATLQALYPKMNLHPIPIGKALNKLGVKRIAKKVRGVVVYGYLCKIILPPSNDK
jgi:predicted P-loop ATPase